MKLAELERAAELGCWWCRVIFTGIKNMPTWDPAKPVPNRTEFYLEKSRSGISIISLDGPRDRVPEPTLLFYADGQKGKLALHDHCS
jgi:hypothetical protein